MVPGRGYNKTFELLLDEEHHLVPKNLWLEARFGTVWYRIHMAESYSGYEVALECEAERYVEASRLLARLVDEAVERTQRQPRGRVESLTWEVEVSGYDWSCRLHPLKDRLGSSDSLRLGCISDNTACAHPLETETVTVLTRLAIIHDDKVGIPPQCQCYHLPFALSPKLCRNLRWVLDRHDFDPAFSDGVFDCSSTGPSPTTGNYVFIDQWWNQHFFVENLE